LVEHLLNQGHERIAYLSQVHFPLMSHHPLLQIRHRSYQQTLLTHGITAQPEWVFSPPILHEPDYDYYGYESMKLWLKNGWEDLHCTALLCQNDLCAMGAINALEEAGIRVPDDVSVAGYDGSEIFCVRSRGLTTVQVPLHDIGTTGLQLLAARAANPQQPIINQTLPVRLMVGQSTAGINRQHIAQAI